MPPKLTDMEDKIQSVATCATSLGKVSLREYVDLQFKLVREYVDLQFKLMSEYVDLQVKSIESATKVATTTLNERLATMNEFRTSLKDQAAQFITRSEFEVIKDTVSKTVSRTEFDVLKDVISKTVTQAEHEALLSDVRSLRESRATLEGKASQNSVIVALFIAGSGLLLSACSLVFGGIGIFIAISEMVAK